jgi:hypothetical protein
MSEGKTPRRPPSAQRIDRALAGWPMPQRTAAEWERSAERIVARIERGDAQDAQDGPVGDPTDVSDEALLRSPLPATRNEMQNSAERETQGSSPAMSTEPREKSRSSFADLAKLAQRTPPPSGTLNTPEREENSGVINLAALQASGDSEPPAPGVPAAAPTVPSAVAAVAPVVPSERRAPVAAPAPRRRSAGWMAGVGLAAAAAAVAVAVFGLRHPANSASGAAGAVVAVTPAPTQKPAKSQGEATHSSPAQAAGATDNAIDPSRLPLAQPPSAARPAAVAVAANAPAQAKDNSKGSAAVAPPAAAAPVAPAAPTAEARAGAGSDKSLESLMQEAAGSPAGAAPRPAAPQPAAAPESPGGSVPLRPSLGAINGAIGTAMPGARACIDVDAPVSRATVTFNSDGSVGSVAITGWAAGKPAEECIRSALSKARVPPFAQPTYTVPATIRSN